MGVEIISRKKYNRQLQHQGWHDNLDQVRSFIIGKSRIDIATEAGYQMAMQNENLMDNLINMAMETSFANSGDEDAKMVVEQVIRNSIKDSNNPFLASREASDAMANNANYAMFNRINPWVIIGYSAVAKFLDMYHTVTTDDPTMSYKYNLDYMQYGTDPTKYFSPQAQREGTLPTYKMPNIVPTMVGQEGFDHLETLTQGTSDGQYDINSTIVDKDNKPSTTWISVKNGVRGNIFKDAGDSFDASKYTLEKNPMISGIAYDLTSVASDAKRKKNSMQCWVERKSGTGEQQKKIFMESGNIDYETSSGSIKSVPYSIMGELDLDNGDYMFTAIGPITHIQLNVKVTNVANEYKTGRAGTLPVLVDFNVDNHPYNTVPIAPEVVDDFNIGGENVTFVAHYTDKVTKDLAIRRDDVMQDELDESYARGPKNFQLYSLLGGFKGSVQFPLDARLPGGGDPYSWASVGLKNTVINHLLNAEESVYFEDGTPREWILFGSEIDTQRFLDQEYEPYDGEGGIGAGQEKYGFAVGKRCGFITSHGQRVKIIGSTYKKHRVRDGVKRPIMAINVSRDITQPTNIYVPYSFRVYSGIMNEYDHRTGIIVAARDCIKVLTCVQSRITLTGNDDNLYNSIVQKNKTVVAIDKE